MADRKAPSPPASAQPSTQLEPQQPRVDVASYRISTRLRDLLRMVTDVDAKAKALQDWYSRKVNKSWKDESVHFSEHIKIREDVDSALVMAMAIEQDLIANASLFGMHGYAAPGAKEAGGIRPRISIKEAELKRQEGNPTALQADWTSFATMLCQLEGMLINCPVTNQDSLQVVMDSSAFWEARAAAQVRLEDDFLMEIAPTQQELDIEEILNAALSGKAQRFLRSGDEHRHR